MTGMEIIRGRLAAKDVSNPALRYNPDTDTVEFSPDNGTTWVDMPSLDPRTSPAFLLPPLTGDARCDAAANMVKWMKDFLDEATALLGAGSEALAIANMAIPLYELISGGSLTLLAIITEFAGTLFSLGYAALLAAFDSTTYDDLLCAFYCNIGVDGQVTAAQLVDVETQVTDTLNTTAGIVVDTLLFLQGEVGLSNAGVIGAQTGDCSGCDCGWEACIVGTDLATVFAISGTNGTFTGAGVETVTAVAGGDPSRPRTQAYITAALDSCTVDRLQCFFDAPDGFANSCGGSFATSYFGQNNFGTLIALGSGTPSSPFVFVGALTLTDLQVGLGVACCDGCGTPPNVGTITEIRIRGTGTTPSQLVPFLC